MFTPNYLSIMKRISILFVLSIFLFSTARSQSVPQGMKYQAVARDLKGNVLANQPIELKIALISDVDRQTIAYSETHSVTTNEVGLFNLVIGEGDNSKGLFEEVPWSSYDIWMEVSIKDKDATDFAVISNSRLLAVPYAFHAGTANELAGPTGRGSSGGGVPANVWTLFGNSNVDDSKDRLGTTDCADLIMITNNLERLRITCEGDINITNSLSVGVNLDVGNDVHIGNDLTVDQDVFLNVDGGNTTVNGDLTVDNMSSTYLTGTLTVDKATDLNLTLNVDGTTTLNDDLTVTGMNPTLLTGTLTVDKATDLNLTLNVDGATDLNSSLDVNNMSPTHLTGNLTVDKLSTLTGMVSINDATQSTSTTTGALKVAGGVGIVKNANVGGTLTVDGVSTLKNTLNVTAGSSYIANFVNTTDGNGLSIQVANGTPDTDNNFVTFKNSGGTTVGRIEGQTADELHNSFGYIWYQTMNALNDAFAVALIIADLVGVDDPDAAVVEGVELALAIAEWLKVTIELDLNVGVVYESGSGDYAEWLAKDLQNEVFSYGDIVGVKGGRISKSMENPDQYMVVSLSPIILGNMPPSGLKDQYEKVAFMGQVPVKVRGVVNIGDYILASDMEDGFGHAVAPEMMTLDQFKRIVGVAWSSADGKSTFSMINVAVGINTNDTVEKLKEQQKELDALKSTMNSVVDYLKSTDPTFEANRFAVASKPTETQNQTAMAGKAEEQFYANYGNNKMVAISKYLNDNPDVLNSVQAETKALLDERGIDYNRFEQTKRLLNDSQYLIAVIMDKGSKN